VKLSDLATPALVADSEVLEANIAAMAAVLPGERLRPHVKAHKCTELARRQYAAGHHRFTCATVREAEGMARAGLGEDLLLANEVVSRAALERLAALDAQVTLAVDSEETVRRAAGAGIREVLIDVNVGLPRCGCPPEQAGALSELAASLGLAVRGVMGYEGHVVGVEDRSQREEQCETAMEMLSRAMDDVGGEVISAGGTGTYDLNRYATEIQAGSYVLMDLAYGKLGLPFRQGLFVLASVISSSPEGWSVLDCGVKAMSMDHGNPEISGATVWYCSDEHTVFSPPQPVGEQVMVVPAHIDPTIACHETLHLVSGDDVLESWPVDLRGW
jgi:D-serine deaminase-like pyridoxal phosphate-dependent protein